MHNATQFHESFSEAARTRYYLMIGKSTPFTTGTSGGSDDSPPTPSDDVSGEFYTWDSAIAAKRITSSNIQFVIPRRDWANGTTYDMYRGDITRTNTSKPSGATSLYGANYFVVNEKL